MSAEELRQASEATYFKAQFCGGLCVVMAVVALAAAFGDGHWRLAAIPAMFAAGWAYGACYANILEARRLRRKALRLILRGNCDALSNPSQPAELPGDGGRCS